MSSTASKHRIRLQRLSVQNFKAFDNLEVDFPPPRMTGDPDVFVLGSKNGQGKTSLLEASALLFLAGLVGPDIFDAKHFLLERDLIRNMNTPSSLANLMVRAGSGTAQIEGTFVVEGKTIDLHLTLSQKGRTDIEGDRSPLQNLLKQNTSLANTRDNVARFSLILAGLSNDPFVFSPLIYFHSYRKVQEGSPELGMMVDGGRSFAATTHSRSNASSSTYKFKLEVLRSLMSKGGLFENLDSNEADEVLNRVNDLMRQYAGGYIDKLRPSPDNTIEFRVTPNDGGPSFTFDGLSSGQKEIISTLFLIWRYTQNQPGIVLIDEPELHLNPEWHRSFIKNLYTLAPDNQYLIATHSEDVFSAVDKDHRLLLTADKESA